MTSQILRLARQEIEIRGWTQGTREDPVTGAVCLGGALFQVYFNGASQDEVGAACDVLKEACLPWIHPTCWNDAPGRTKADVLALLDRAIAKAEATEQELVSA